MTDTVRVVTGLNPVESREVVCLSRHGSVWAVTEALGNLGECTVTHVPSGYAVHPRADAISTAAAARLVIMLAQRVPDAGAGCALGEALQDGMQDVLAVVNEWRAAEEALEDAEDDARIRELRLWTVTVRVPVLAATAGEAEAMAYLACGHQTAAPAEWSEFRGHDTVLAPRGLSEVTFARAWSLARKDGAA